MADIAPPPYTLPHIPFEIAQVIADHLDVVSARNLALSSKALRDIGELGVWRVLNITNPYEEDFDQYDGSAYHAAAARIDSKIEHAMAAFAAYPFRLQCVQEVKVEPSDGGSSSKRARALMDLLAPISSQITRLDIIPRPYSYRRPREDHSELSSDIFFETMNLASGSAYTRITHLKYSCPMSVDVPVDGWMQRMVNLQELEFSLSDEFCPDDDLDTLDLKPFLYLRRITFDGMETLGGIRAGLALLLKLAPNLQELRLRGLWSPQRHDEALIALGQAKSLKRIVVAGPPEIKSPALNGEDGLEFRKFGRVDLGIEEAVVDVHGLEEAHELDLDEIRLPKAARLKRVTIITAPRPPLAEYVSISLAPTTDIVRQLPSEFVRQLLRTEALTTILLHHLVEFFPPNHSCDFVEPTTLFVHPSEWVEGGFRGIIIRQYRRPSCDEDILWHVRALSRNLFDHSLRVPYVGIRRSWVDFSCYRGRTVPRDTLRAVYGVAGVEMDFAEGGRGLSLGEGEEAWEMLDRWRMPLGSGLDWEGDYDPQQEEPDDVDSGDEEGNPYNGGGPFMMGPHLSAFGGYEDDDGAFDAGDYDDHEPYWGYDMAEDADDDIDWF